MDRIRRRLITVVRSESERRTDAAIQVGAVAEFVRRPWRRTVALWPIPEGCLSHSVRAQQRSRASAYAASDAWADCRFRADRSRRRGRSLTAYRSRCPRGFSLVLRLGGPPGGPISDGVRLRAVAE